MNRNTQSPLLEPTFVPMWEWVRAYAQRSAEKGMKPLVIRLERPDGPAHERTIHVDGDFSDEAYLHFERTIKFLLWQVGGCRVLSDAPAVFLERITREYTSGPRKFDSQIIGESVFGQPISFGPLESADAGAGSGGQSPTGGYEKGCRIGFDLGGSDRKCAAIRDGEVIFSEEVPWDPYHQSDPGYHWQGIVDSIDRAARHLPRIDAIGGSAAGIYIDNEPKVGSLFRGISQVDFADKIRPIFKRLSAHYGNVPIRVVNDGDATALSAAQSRNLKGILGIAMGTSMAVGYVDPHGHLTPWLNELAFAPVDGSPEAPVDEWSGDRGCGVSYFSQQAVGRLIKDTGLSIDSSLGLPEQLKLVQKVAESGDPDALAIFSTIGTCLGYSILHYLDFYSFTNVLLLGRVLSGHGGEEIKKQAKSTLANLAPETARSLSFLQPSELEKRHGQAIAAAGLVPDDELKPA